MLPRSRGCHLFGTMFVYEEIESINKKNGENLKVKGENLLIYDDLAIFGTSS